MDSLRAIAALGVLLASILLGVARDPNATSSLLSYFDGSRSG